MARWKFCLLAACPYCGIMPEDKAHVILCEDPAAMQVRETSLKHLKEWLKSQQTYRSIAEALLQGLAQWHNSSTLQTNPLAKGWVDQMHIGWNGLLDRWVACSWGIQHGKVWLMGCLCKSCKWWTIELIKKLLNVVWDTWEHHNSVLHQSLNAQ